MDEFTLIRQYFTHTYPDVDLGPGDDAALVQVSAGHQLVVSVDALVEGVHFFAGTDPYAIGYKSLAVNLSDMAAMGATPRWATVSLTAPEANADWLNRFSAGLFDLAEQYGTRIIGGDTTQGPLHISIQILGEVPIGQAITRAGAKVGEDIWVSGELGLAAMAVAERYGHLTLAAQDHIRCTKHLDYPLPKVALGIALRGIATAMLDISDGLLADLAHIAECSQLGAEIEATLLPPLALSQHYPEFLAKQLTGGDDYELCFTAPASARAEIETLALLTQTSLHRIGRTVKTGSVACILPDDTLWHPQNLGYTHFTPHHAEKK
jgi:thiamine-monophosphate kinase